MLQITSTRLVQGHHSVIKFDFTLEASARAETLKYELDMDASGHKILP